MAGYDQNDPLSDGFTIYCATLVFFMHAGFTLLETGYVQRKNQQSIVLKNLICLAVGALAFFSVGYGVAYGDSNRDSGKGGFIGTTGYWADEETLASYTEADGTVILGTKHAFFFYQYAFCATAATIVSGALAERCTLTGFAIFTTTMTAFIYPVVAHWGWNNGVLGDEGFTDFAGSGIVHMTGGFAALAGALVLGPRQGAFDGNGLRPSSVLLVVLGSFILWFGWYGFNCGSVGQIAAAGNATAAARTACTTTLAASAGGITLFAISAVKDGTYDVSMWANGILAGLVGITAGANNMDPTASIFVGVIAGFVCDAASKTLVKLQIDDPIGAFPVHGAAGVWGVFAVGLFDMDNGIFYSGDFKDLMRAQMQGIGLIAAWAFGFSLPIFAALNAAGILRCSEELEEAGLDTEFVQAYCSGLE